MQNKNGGARPSSADMQNSASVEYFAASHTHYSSMVTLAMGLAMAVILFGVVVVAAGFLQEEYRHLLADLLAVREVTAAGFVLGACALYVRCVNVAARSARLAAIVNVLSLLLLALGAGTLVHGSLYGLGWLPVDQSHPISPLVIPPLLSVGFVLMAAILLLHDWRLLGGYYPSEYLSFALIGLAAIPLVGYIYGVVQFVYLDFYLPVPLLSAMVFALLGAALLIARPGHPVMAVIMRIAPGGQMLRRLLPQTLFLLLAFSLLLNWGMTHGWIVPELLLPTLTLINGVIILFIFWGSASRLDSEYGERTRNAQKLAETSALLNAVSESTSDPIFVKNRQGLMIFANPATLQKLGKTWEETMYRSSRELFMVEEEADRVDRDDRRVMASGKPEKLEQTMTLPEGTVTFQTAKVPWFGKDGSVQGVIGISTDITERKQAEDVLRQRESQLEKTVIQRTALLRELTNHLETVREEEKRAIARELHDNMGASLTALSMHLEGVYQVLPPDDKWMDRKTRMQGLMKSLVSTTRRIQTELRPNTLDLFGLKAAISEQLDELHERTGIACHASLPDEDVAVGHEMEIAIYRMLQEMLNNVTKHAKASKVDVILDIDEDHVALTVRDDGVGIPEERRDNHKTYGLRGLRERATYFGGQVDIRSTPGKGALITISLPIRPEMAATTS
ncbi:PAS domain-containing protein [Herbaspirillum sp. LeCh32-8]|uniref:PAS domain-containing sensor histidine kinase n=1 Tax=Herbaspirillum sp. LeCh32-8 TaxID=2821356 RepID=UPI001AE76036|nr:PAS domain-containing protein [Herbaspirillum sp. LeCh32-8]MBP0599924.1 PAS domain-containing protein [Herbaspirillum sp. LeCh32-8]